MAAPGVTIAIPNWNHEYVLPRSIVSALRAVRLLRARGVSGEVLVIDDQSRDGSMTLLRQLEALHFADGLQVLSLRRNLGLPAVRNQALFHATYRHIVFMDADNELVPANLHDFYRAARETAAAAIYGNLLCDGGSLSEAALASNETFQARMYVENYIDAFAMFDRLQVIDCGGYLNSLDVQAREDWELYLHLASNGRRIVFVPLVFGYYHRLPGSMIKEADSSSDHAQQQAHVRRVFDQLGIRGEMPLKTRHLRYHPDLGYL
jgi:glycosyltransferase involved in cell wall biosynthesis